MYTFVITTRTRTMTYDAEQSARTFAVVEKLASIPGATLRAIAGRIGGQIAAIRAAGGHSVTR